MLRPRYQPPPPSSCRDRTREFRGAVERACGVSGGPLGGAPSASEFRRRAAGIGLGIDGASRKLARLAQLLKSTAIFDDPTVDIQNLIAAINKEIAVLKAAVSDLQILLNSQNEGGNIISRDAGNHSAAIVDILKEGLMKIAKEFNEVLTTWKNSLRVHQDRRNIFSSSASEHGSYPSVRHDQQADSMPPAPWATNSAFNSLFQRQTNRGDASWPSGQQQQLAVQQGSYMQSRDEALQNLESSANELAEIFTQLLTMVTQQGDVAIRIDENMDDTLANVEGAQGQLLKHLNNLSSNRWLMSKIFAVLVVFLLIFVIFVT